MTTKVSKWGNSLGVRLPKNIVDSLHIGNGSEVKIERNNATIVITPKEKMVFTVEDLIVGMTEEGVLDQFEPLKSIGKEIIE